MPEELGVEEQEELTSFGGLITKELGRIPEVGEILKLKNLQITILEADETRVQLTEVKLLSSPNEPAS